MRVSWQHSYSKQVGVIRTNCMDCLDRSNVVQAFYGLKVGVVNMIVALQQLHLVDTAETVAGV